MKRLNLPVIVEVRRGRPRRIRRGRRTYHVRRVLDYWVLQTRWWAREERRVYFRLETDQGVVEVYRSDAMSNEASGRAGRPGRFHVMDGDTHEHELRSIDLSHKPLSFPQPSQKTPDATVRPPHRRNPAQGPLRGASGWVLSTVLD